tara:strand:+ start:141 stop:398 length:258 start_codon:yes stop_codon:yes gene_type:complete
MKVYCDTNIFLDFFDDRNDHIRPLGEFTFQIFKRAINCEFHIVFSTHVKKELISQGVTDEKIKEIFDLLGIKIIFVSFNCSGASS